MINKFHLFKTSPHAGSDYKTSRSQHQYASSQYSRADPGVVRVVRSNPLTFPSEHWKSCFRRPNFQNLSGEHALGQYSKPPLD